ncbi:MAG: hypothetical protein A2X64_09555 [Ignavibacteria bacterium GWF2_33_9]|nr:MAG: hypothetical protein A2X64_09555 [Ignavibacteria bacterium GWF2_33_9]
MNSNNTILNDIAKKIKISQNILIITHSNPDGDGIGSMLAMYFYASQFCEKIKCLIVDEVPKNLKFLSGTDKIEKFNSQKHTSFLKKSDLILFLDFNDLTRIRELGTPVAETSAYKIMIDHHPDTKDIAHITYVNTHASSTGELVWNIISNDIEAKLNINIVNALYAAIMTDTGSFRFSSTTAKVHEIIAQLIDLGADPYLLYDKIYNQSSINVVRLLGLVLSELKLFESGKVCIMQISEDMFRKTNTTTKDTEFIVERTLGIEGVLVGILLTEVKERNEIKISLRSKREVEINKVANNLGGGGHRNASGANIKNVTLENATEMVLRQISKLNLAKNL